MKRGHWICIAFFYAFFACSTSSERSRSNERNINKIKVGMNLDQVKDIMGVPDQVLIYPFNDKEYDVIYTAPSKYDDDFHVYLSRQDSTVLRVVDGD